MIEREAVVRVQLLNKEYCNGCLFAEESDNQGYSCFCLIRQAYAQRSSISKNLILRDRSPCPLKEVETEEKKEECKECHGTGAIRIGDKNAFMESVCRKCKGKGSLEEPTEEKKSNRIKETCRICTGSGKVSHRWRSLENNMTKTEYDVCEICDGEGYVNA